MRNKLLIIFIVFVSSYYAQQNAYQKIRELAQLAEPKVNLENKILVINFEQNVSTEHQETCLDMEKTAKVYGKAKLTGGKDGVICVQIIKDSQEEIAMNKAGFTNIIKIKASQIELPLDGEIRNCVINSEGNAIYKNLATNSIYEAIHKLITR